MTDDTERYLDDNITRLFLNACWMTSCQVLKNRMPKQHFLMYTDVPNDEFVTEYLHPEFSFTRGPRAPLSYLSVTSAVSGVRGADEHEIKKEVRSHVLCTSSMIKYLLMLLSCEVRIVEPYAVKQIRACVH